VTRVPAEEIERRGGATKVRTKKLPGGRYMHVYVVNDAGPEGGHTVAGEVKRRKGGPDPDDQPDYRLKPDVPSRPTRKKKEAPRAKK
jgi:hypothetical protein